MQVDAKLRVLWVSDSPLLATGFARVTREVTRRLASRHGVDVACLAWGYRGWPYNKADLPVDLYPADFDSHGAQEFAAVAAHYQPDLVVTLAEIWMVEWLVNHPLRQRFKWIAYVPLDGGPFYPPWEAFVKGADEVVAMSMFGQAVLESGVPSKRVRMIYHGVDTNVFRRLENRERLKSHDPFRGKFVVGCVARNQPRKNIPALVKAFALLRQRPEMDNLYLYLHMGANDIGFDLPALLARYRLYGCADIAGPEFAIDRALTDEQLCQLYNLFDVMVLPSSGEGFGLPLLESMAAGVPVVATDCSACAELVRGRGELAAVRSMVTMGHNLIEHAFVHERDLADRIAKLYSDPELWKTYSSAARQFASFLDWERVMPLWVEAIRGLFPCAAVSEAGEAFVREDFLRAGGPGAPPPDPSPVLAPGAK